MLKKGSVIFLLTALASVAWAEVNLGLDVFNRYVWRGSDFGNSASFQPSMEYASEYFTIGAWGAWSVDGSAGGNENDLYLSTQVGPLDLTLTDYFFPAYTGTDQILDLDNHILELSAGGSFGDFAALVAYNFSGDVNNSAYLELAYQFFTIGMGNGFYTVKDDPDFNIVHVGVSASKDIFSVSYILNPEQETSFLVFGISL
ncbi:MAG: hypothetical protein K9M49_02860 [Candidatus Marinimicrobia bacterium]|nr:hypothetical protein [Candidatus Neomarinimicrobiota bacterium]MCF7904075.1 hypothetical protein [Candidatus Neomarinimicrobiota bacterium]